MRDAESDVGAALRRDGRAAAYEGTGVGVRGRARRRRAVEARGGRFRCFWRCPHGWRLGKATPGLVRLGMQQRASSSGPFSCVANVVALRLRCRDMPSCPVFREPFLRRRGASLPERRVWRTLPWVSNLRFVRCRACHGSVGAFEARGGGAHQFRERRLAFLHRASRRTSRRTPWSSVAARGRRRGS